MAYSKKTWVDSEVITKEALNNIESGIANAALKQSGVVSISASNAAAAQPTQAEFNKVVTDLKILAAKLNAMNA